MKLSLPTCILRAIILSCCAASALAQTAPAPLPNVEQLRQRAVASLKSTADQRERYLCRELLTSRELDGKGNVKKAETAEREIFFVNGHQISQTIAQNGKPLSDSEKKKQQEAVTKAIAEASKPPDPTKHRSGFSFSTDDFLRLARLTNERRVDVAGRPTILFDAAGDPQAHTDSMAQKIMEAMAGTVAIDEKTGNPIDIAMHGVRDVKIGGGLVANIHKGFMLHVKLSPRPDGVWLIDTAEGSGDARIGLFFHPAGDFNQKTESCELSTVTTQHEENIPPTPRPN